MDLIGLDYKSMYYVDTCSISYQGVHYIDFRIGQSLAIKLVVT